MTGDKEVKTCGIKSTKLRILCAFDIGKALDEEEKLVEVDPHSCTFDITLYV